MIYEYIYEFGGTNYYQGCRCACLTLPSGPLLLAVPVTRPGPALALRQRRRVCRRNRNCQRSPGLLPEKQGATAPTWQWFASGSGHGSPLLPSRRPARSDSSRSWTANLRPHHSTATALARSHLCLLATRTHSGSQRLRCRPAAPGAALPSSSS